MATDLLHTEANMSTPVDFVPCFSIYVSETAQRAYAENFGSQAAAVAFAEKNLRAFVVRRSQYRINREIYRGMVVYSKRFAHVQAG